MHFISTIFPFIRYLDLANSITAFNIIMAISTITLASLGHLAVASTSICLATAIDFIDGHIARTYLADRLENRAFGKQLDSLSDLLNFSVAPALVLAQVLPAATTVVVAGFLVLSGGLRLAFFGATTPVAPTNYTGLPTTYSGFLLAVLFQWVATQQPSTIPLLVAVTLISVLQVSFIRFPKYKAVPTVLSIVISFSLLTMLMHLI